ncbi:MAG: hypothetical protein OXJ53_02840 [Gammaproteobacteria bacterium]|nr:hypothetical protein [Gammaproteobacteria bacterium]
MTPEPNTHRVLSIWRRFTPSRRLLSADEAQRLDQASDLHEEVYSWQVREPVLDGIADDQDRERLDAILAQFDVNRRPNERDLAVLQEFVALAEQVIESGGSGSIAGQSSSDAEEEVPEIDALLALTLHLKWLVACFANRPGISVSVR